VVIGVVILFLHHHIGTLLLHDHLFLIFNQTDVQLGSALRKSPEGFKGRERRKGLLVSNSVNAASAAHVRSFSFLPNIDPWEYE
jgi:hypothetical protein